MRPNPIANLNLQVFIFSESIIYKSNMLIDIIARARSKFMKIAPIIQEFGKEQNYLAGSVQESLIEGDEVKGRAGLLLSNN